MQSNKKDRKKAIKNAQVGYNPFLHKLADMRQIDSLQEESKNM